ncbi:MAG: ornithine cyclodeaminase family protein [Streptosporangiales bacterium]|nr:ornithine cyclodeaminase family protein [Streptosporangiales bacterium]
MIDGGHLRRLVSMADAVEAVREAFRLVSGGQFLAPQRVAVGGGTELLMAGRPVENPEGFVTKILTVRPENPGRGLPLLHAVVLWFDGPTGEPLAVLDGETVTAMRTGAASGVATDLLAAPDASTLALIGSGAQARDQVEAVLAVRQVREVRIFSRNETTANELAATLAEAHTELDVRVVPTSSQAVRGAEVVCCATTARAPVFDAADVGPRTHVNAIGSYRPDMCEVPAELLARSRVVVDQREAALAGAGDVIQAIEAGQLDEKRLVEVGDLLLAAERQASEAPTVFKSVGVSAQDWALARVAVERAAASAWS